MNKIGKRHINLTVEDEFVELAKSRGINISQLLRDTLRQTLEISVDKDFKSKKNDIELDIAKLNKEIALKKMELKEVKRQEENQYGKVLKEITFDRQAD